MPLLLTAIFGILFFYRLDFKTLSSWDEAWYGAISKNIINTGNVFDISFNGMAFHDHPPLGFWLTAISYKIFGVSEFSSRFPSAVLGLATIIAIYYIGTIISKRKVVGLCASIILGTSVWYVMRVRSGNLDSLLMFNYTITFLLALHANTSYKYFPLTMFFAALTALSKNTIGLLILPIVIYMNWQNIFSKKNIRTTFWGIGTFFIVFLPWYIFETIKYGPGFLIHHFLKIGTRSKTLLSYFDLQFSQTFFYIHMGIRKWYYVWLLGASWLVFSLKQKYIKYLFVWLTVLMYPFLTSEKTEIWHLIPLYGPIALMISIGLFEGFEFITKKIAFLPKHTSSALLLVTICAIATVQIKTFIPEIVADDKWIPDNVDISKRLTKYDDKIYFLDDFFPIAVYYSGRNIYTVKNINTTFERNENFVLLIRNWAISDLDKQSRNYEVLEKNGTFSIIKNIK